MADYIEILFQHIPSATRELLIAQLSENGFEGFQEDIDWLKAFIPAADFDESFLKELSKSMHISFSKSIIKETNWNEVWESSFQPIIIDDFAAIRASFHKPVTGVTHEIIITPKMSFGTGHHATTYMMILQMREIEFKNKIVFDFGTGTGLLSILAEKLGASTIIAVDNDPWSITNAAENLERNKCNRVILEKANSVGQQKFDIILANINKNVILNNFEALIQQLNEGGVLLISGLLQDDEKDILNESVKYPIQLQKITASSHWISLKFIY